MATRKASTGLSPKRRTTVAKTGRDDASRGNSSSSHPLRLPPLVFLSYAREDEAWTDVLLIVLKFFELKGLIRVFHDKSNIRLGERWRQSVGEALHEASLAICLLTPQYFASEFVVEYEVPLIQKRQKQGLLRVFPILLKDSILEIDPWWLELQILKDEHGRPLINGNGSDKDQIQQHFVKLARQILHILPELPEPPEPTRPAPVGSGQSLKNASKATGNRRGSSGRLKGTKNLVLPTVYQHEEQFVSELLNYLHLNNKTPQELNLDDRPPGSAVLLGRLGVIGASVLSIDCLDFKPEEIGFCGEYLTKVIDTTNESGHSFHEAPIFIDGSKESYCDKQGAHIRLKYVEDNHFINSKSDIRPARAWRDNFSDDAYPDFIARLAEARELEQAPDGSAPIEITEHKGHTINLGLGADLVDLIIEIFRDCPKCPLGGALAIEFAACHSELTTREAIKEPEVLAGPDWLIKNSDCDQNIITRPKRAFNLEIAPECIFWRNPVDASGRIRPS